MQAQLNNILGLHHTNSRVSIDSITSFAGSTDTRSAFKKFCQNLYKIGVRADMIREKESEILNIFNPQHTATSNQICNSNPADPRKAHNPASSGQINDNDIANQSKPQNTAISSQIDDNSHIMDQSRLPVVSDFSGIQTLVGIY